MSVYTIQMFTPCTLFRGAVCRGAYLAVDGSVVQTDWGKTTTTTTTTTTHNKTALNEKGK